MIPVAHPRHFAVHAVALHDPAWADDPATGTPDALALRLLPRPELGLPLGPFGVIVSELRSDPDWRTAVLRSGSTGATLAYPVEVHDGSTWFRLFIPRIGYRDPRPILVRLIGEFADGTEVAAVAGYGDRRPGITTVYEGAEERILNAPDTTWVRVTGRSRIDAASVLFPDREVWNDGERMSLGLPLGVIAAPDGIGYLGDDPDESRARARLERFAPTALPAHERPQPDLTPVGAAAAAELARLDALIRSDLVDLVGRVASNPVLERREPERPPAVVAHLLATRTASARVPLLDRLLVAGGDPSIARWLGFADRVVRPEGEIVAITVAGRWAVPEEVAPLFWLGEACAPIAVEILEQVGLSSVSGAQMPDGYRAVSLWAQAMVHVGTLASLPPAPVPSSAGPGIWRSTDGGDRVRFPVRLTRIAALAQAGVVEMRGGTPEPLHAPVPGVPPRRRPLLVKDGVELALDAAAGTAEVILRTQQADMFGRWGEASPDVLVGVPARPPIPAPQPRWLVLDEPGPPDDDAPWSPVLHLDLPIPARAPGQPEIAAIEAFVDGEPVGLMVSDGQATWRGAPVALRPGDPQRPVALRVRFTGSDGSEETVDGTMTLVDRRPPVPPPARELVFADPADAAGHSTFRVSLEDRGPEVLWEVYVTTESRLRRKKSNGEPTVKLELLPGESADDRNAVARARKRQRDDLKRELFDLVTPGAVPSSAEGFPLRLSGDLADVTYLRVIPVRDGARPAFTSADITPVAVPTSLAPVAPRLGLVPGTWPMRVRLTTVPGRVPPTAWRLRLLPDGPAPDVRLAAAVASGTLPGPGEAELVLPAVRPFARLRLVAEVQGAAETGALGQEPEPRWSPPSDALDLVAVPPEPPQLITAATSVEGAVGTTITVSLSGLPRTTGPRPYRLRVARQAVGATRPSTVDEVAVPAGTDPVVTIAVVTDLDDLLKVTLVDPLGRAAEPQVVTSGA